MNQLDIQSPAERRLRKHPIRHFRPTAPVTLPRDDYAHYWAQVEWWYYTGSLLDEDSRRYGFELTFFKRITNEDRLPILGIPAHWLRDVGMVSHFAISDIGQGKFSYKTIHNLLRSSRADPDGYHVSIGGWGATRERGAAHRLSAAMRGYAVDLVLVPTKPAALHGDHGVVEKRDGDANYYYSYTNMRAAGSLVVDGRPLSVSGKAWMDHEYGTITIGIAERGWDWFSIQLDDNSEVMIHAIRNAHNAVLKCYGTYVGPGGDTLGLGHDDIYVRPTSFWYSTKTRSNYPVSWDVRVKPLDMRLVVKSLLANQELVTRLIPYWEGIVRIEGTRGARPVAGHGYAELVGYSNKRSFRKYHRWVSKK
jgi:predicted secreted hydrolase